MNHFDYTGYFEKVAADMPALVGKSILPGGIILLIHLWEESP